MADNSARLVRHWMWQGSGHTHRVAARVIDCVGMCSSLAWASEPCCHSQGYGPSCPRGPSHGIRLRLPRGVKSLWAWLIDTKRVAGSGTDADKNARMNVPKGNSVHNPARRLGPDPPRIAQLPFSKFCKCSILVLFCIGFISFVDMLALGRHLSFHRATVAPFKVSALLWQR